MNEMKIEKAWTHKCGCVMRRDPQISNIWIKLSYCKEHKPKKDE